MHLKEYVTIKIFKRILYKIKFVCVCISIKNNKVRVYYCYHRLMSIPFHLNMSLRYTSCATMLQVCLLCSLPFYLFILFFYCTCISTFFQESELLLTSVVYLEFLFVSFFFYFLMCMSMYIYTYMRIFIVNEKSMFVLDLPLK